MTSMPLPLLDQHPVTPARARPGSGGRAAYIETYGCQMNVADSELVARILGEAGFRIVDRPEQAEIVLINTCAVREHAEERVFGRAAQLHGLRAHTPNLTIGILGCMAQREGESLLRQFPHVDLVCGTREFSRIGDLVRDVEHGAGPVLALGEYGSGRTIALTVDGSHKLLFSTFAAGAAGRGHGAFWDALLGWLMRDPRFEPARIELPEGDYSCIRGLLSAANGNASIRLRVVYEDGDRRRLDAHRLVFGSLDDVAPVNAQGTRGWQETGVGDLGTYFEALMYDNTLSHTRSVVLVNTARFDMRTRFGLEGNRDFATYLAHRHLGPLVYTSLGEPQTSAE